ncbi:hypothetical protein ACRRTK_018849 [Alexandromys fortis]
MASAIDFNPSMFWTAVEGLVFRKTLGSKIQSRPGCRHGVRRSFICKQTNVHDIREVLGEEETDNNISKIENHNVHRFDEILEASVVGGRPTYLSECVGRRVCERHPCGQPCEAAQVHMQLLLWGLRAAALQGQSGKTLGPLEPRGTVML